MNVSLILVSAFLFGYIVSLHLRINTIEEFLNKRVIPVCDANSVGPCAKGVK